MTDGEMKKLANEESVAAVVDAVKSAAFWKDVELLVDVLWPVMILLRLLDSDLPVMGVIVHGWRALRARLQSSVASATWGDVSADGSRTVGKEELDKMLGFYDARSANLGPIHYAAYLTNPALLDISKVDDPVALPGFIEYANIVFAGCEDRDAKVQKALQQLVDFKSHAGQFNNAQAVAQAREVVLVPGTGMLPSGWWSVWGLCAPELKEVAVKALGQVVSVGAAERGHKTHKFLQTKIRNRMASSTASKLIVVHQSLRLRGKQDEDDDARLAAAIAAIDEWWAEEEMGMRDGEPRVADWETAPAMGPAGADDARPQFFAWVEGWEAEKMKCMRSGPAFRKKYVGMMVELEEEDGEDGCVWEVADVVWNPAPRTSGGRRGLPAVILRGEGRRRRRRGRKTCTCSSR